MAKRKVDPVLLKVALAEMKAAVKKSEIDEESAHGDADDILCNLLCELGYEAVVDEFHKVHKWYA